MISFILGMFVGASIGVLGLAMLLNGRSPDPAGTWPWMTPQPASD
jgi:hypothetical protein